MVARLLPVLSLSVFGRKATTTRKRDSGRSVREHAEGQALISTRLVEESKAAYWLAHPGESDVQVVVQMLTKRDGMGHCGTRSRQFLKISSVTPDSG
jgi:hypothetical protein